MPGQKERDSKDTSKESGKEGGKGKKERDETLQLLRRLTDEVAALRAELHAPSTRKSDTLASATGSGPSNTGAEAEWQTLLSALQAVSVSEPVRPSQDETVAQFGYAFSSAPKVTLIRLLLENGPQPAATLGDGANLTTGSLYHHLRELIHAQVVVQEARSRYALTESGKRVARLLFGLTRLSAR